MSADRPGKMGWGEIVESEEQKLSTESRISDAIADADPVFATAHAAKPANKDILARLKDEQSKDGIDDGICVKHMEQVVFGFSFAWLAQIVGSCVASGYMRICLYRTLVEIFLLNQPEEVFGTELVGTNNLATYAPYNYRAGRSKANMNRGDGSYCSVHISGAKDYGHLPCSTPGIRSDAFPEPQSGSLYRSYGNSDKILRDFSDTGRKFKLLESAEIKDADFGKEQMVEGYKPAMICSMWAFEPDYKHPTWKLRDGSPVYIYKRNRRTSWAHNMSVVGFVEVSGKWFVIIENSWGMRAHKNGSWFAIPLTLFAEWIRSAQCRTVGELDLLDSGNPV